MYAAIDHLKPFTQYGLKEIHGRIKQNLWHEFQRILKLF